MTVKLGIEHIKWLLSKVEMSPEDRDVLINSSRFKSLIINDELAERLRDAVCDQLVLKGFDVNYDPNSFGKECESMINVLYID